MRNQFDNEAFDKLKESDKKMILLSCPAASPWYTPDESVVCEDAKLPLSATSIKSIYPLC